MSKDDRVRDGLEQRFDMHLLLICDPEISPASENMHGVQQIVAQWQQALEHRGCLVTLVTAAKLPKVPSSSYGLDSLIRLVGTEPIDCVHIVTQGEVGLMALRYCRLQGIPFTCSYLTRYAFWLHSRYGLPEYITNLYVSWFLRHAAQVIIPSSSVGDEVQRCGVKSMRVVPLGVDCERFTLKEAKSQGSPSRRPNYLYVGRVAEEKGVRELCAVSSRLRGSLRIVGDGPLRAELERAYSEITFTGQKSGDSLVAEYQHADVFIFPSRSETFGLVLLEALACGVPVAAVPAPGAIDLMKVAGVAAVDEDLAEAAHSALPIDPTACRTFALKFSWGSSAAALEDALKEVSSEHHLPKSQAETYMHWLRFEAIARLVRGTEKLLFGNEVDFDRKALNTTKGSR